MRLWKIANFVQEGFVSFRPKSICANQDGRFLILDKILSRRGTPLVERFIFET